MGEAGEERRVCRVGVSAVSRCMLKGLESGRCRSGVRLGIAGRWSELSAGALIK